MKVILIYNPHDSREVALLDRAKQEMASYVEEVAVVDFQEVRNVFKIRATPALIFIRDDMQGDQLLVEDQTQAKLRLALECAKVQQEEEANLYNQETARIDNVVKTEIETRVTTRLGEERQVMQDMAALLIENGVV